VLWTHVASCAILTGMNEILPVSSFPDLRLAGFSVGQGRHLPRWEAAGAIYHVALHLADSVPQTQLEIWKAERERLNSLAKEARRPLTEDERSALKAVYEERVEKYLAAGHGACLLREAHASEALAEVLTHGNGSRYALHEWCIMPNHVHVIVGGFSQAGDLNSVLSIWKRTSGHRINAMLQREGSVWHRDGYTRIIRDAAEYRRQISYVWNNPESAGLQTGFRRERYVGG